MRTLVLIIIPIFCSFLSVSQRIAIGDSVTMELLGNMKKLSTTEVSALAQEKFGKTKYLSNSIKIHPENVFQLDDMLVLILSRHTTKPIPDYTKSLKIAFDDTGLKIPNWSSNIEDIGDKNVLIIKEVSEGFNLYRFFGINNTEDGIFNGFIQYQPGDNVKVKPALNDLIKSIKFNNN